MVEYIPDAIRKYPVSFGIALIPVLIGNLLISPLLTNPEVNISTLEFHNKTSNHSVIYTIIENLGNSPSEHIKIYFDTKNPYILLGYRSVDSIPINNTGSDGYLRVSIDRLAPQSFTILKATAPISYTEKTIWLTSDKETKFVTLPSNTTDSGVSSIDFTNQNDAAVVTGGVGILILLLFRYVNFYKSEAKRKDFLGVHQIKIVRFRSIYFWAGAGAIIFGIIIGMQIDEGNQKIHIQNYAQYKAFPLDKNMTSDKFLFVKNPNTPIVTGGSVLSFFSILFALYFSNKDINLPKFDWSLKPSPDNVKVNQITSSYLKAGEYSIKARRDLSKEDKDIFVVTDGLEIIGLLSAKEIEKLDLGKKPSFQSVFKNKDLPSPRWDKTNFKRDNFIIVDENTTVEELKRQMEKAAKRYAVIQYSSKNTLGVVSYDLLFGPPDIFV